MRPTLALLLLTACGRPTPPAPGSVLDSGGDGGGSSGGDTGTEAPGGDGGGGSSGPCVEDAPVIPCPDPARVEESCGGATFTVEVCGDYTELRCDNGWAGERWVCLDTVVLCMQRWSDSTDFCGGTSFMITYGDCPALPSDC